MNIKTEQLNGLDMTCVIVDLAANAMKKMQLHC
jgi:hypothetical protein